MSELISGKEALIALANGEEVECRAYEKNWINANNRFHPLNLFFDDSFQFRLKPRTITLNGIEVPAPDHIETNPNLHGGWAINIGSEYYMYKSESNYNIVIAALRSVFGKK